MVIIASSGQSNAVGRGVGGWPSAVYDSRVLVWNNVAENGGDGSEFVYPQLGKSPFHTRSDGKHAQNASLAFAHRVAQETQGAVKLLNVAKGATPLEQWANNTGAATPMADAMIRIHGLSGCGPVSVMMHAGHEGNVGSDYAEQRGLFLDLFARYEAEGVCDANTVYLLTGTAESVNSPARAAYNEQVLQGLANENDRIRYADSSDLMTFDGTHYTGIDLIRMGYERAWNAASDVFLPVYIAGTEEIVRSGREASGEWIEYSSGRRECTGLAYLEVVNTHSMRATWNFPGGEFVSMPLDVSHTIIGDAVTTPRTMSVSDAWWLQSNSRLVSRGSLEVRMRNLNAKSFPFVDGDYLVLSMRATGRWK